MKNDRDTIAVLVENHLNFANKLAHEAKRSLPKRVSFDEIQSAAYYGLVEAASRFDATLGVPFISYSHARIVGAIKDYLRSLKEHRSLEFDVPHTSIDNSTEFYDFMEKSVGQKGFAILRDYYVDRTSMKEIGKSIGVSESRVSQLISGYKKDFMNQLNELAA